MSGLFLGIFFCERLKNEMIATIMLVVSQEDGIGIAQYLLHSNFVLRIKL